ncbi:antibiotic biosynthesis monooxygenase [Dactylosporangium sp. NPDC000555]|uniref:putative quinol monooxygenase n=1 Tax=Dactylosporangium sp. NPDC000555 TaxID=3154260 RepID=UPI00332CA5B4
MFGLLVRFDLRDEDAARAFDRLAGETGEAVRSNEPGTLVYTMHHVVDEPLARVVYEVYRDREAFDDHRRQEHTRRFLAECDRYVASTRVEGLVPGTGDSL